MTEEFVKFPKIARLSREVIIEKVTECKTCAQCGGHVSPSRGPVTIAFPGETVVVPDVEQDVCGSCGERYLTPEAVEYVQREAWRRKQ